MPAHTAPENHSPAGARERELEVALASVLPYRELDEDTRAALRANARLRMYSRGDCLWREGDPPGDPAFVVEGCVKMVRHPGDEDVILEILTPGDALGVAAVQGGFDYPASAVCLSPVRVLFITNGAYTELLARDAEFAARSARGLALRVQGLASRVDELSGRRVEVRIARLLLELGHRAGRAEGDGIRIPIALTRREVAESCGTTVESAIRVLSAWSRKRLVLSSPKGFLIPDPVALQAIGLDRDPS